jgi:GNAT superfamily N-acetyltransferase
VLDALDGVIIRPMSRTISVERRYLTLPAPSAFRRKEGVSAPLAASLRPLERCDCAEWRALYRTVGAPWQWFDRDAWSDAQLANYLTQPSVAVWAVDLVHPDTVHNIGMLELAAHDDGSIEIVYLGLLSAYHGHGLGAWLLEEAVSLAWQRGATRVWLHTCTLDAPAALPNYLARGFLLERTEQYTATVPD